jgi:hypothetical protein
MKIKDIGFLKDKEYEILLDDSIQTIKEKFFVMEEFDIKRNPNVLRLVLDNEDVTSYLFKLKKYTDLNQLRDIEIKSLYDEIHNVHNEMHEKNMEDLYTYFKNIYVDLTIEDLEHIYKTSDKTSDKISNKTSDKTPDYVKRWQDEYKKLTNKYKLLYKQERDNLDYRMKKTNDLHDTHIYSVVFNSVDMEYKLNDSFENKSLFIKLQDIFYYLQLDADIPLIALDKKQLGVNSGNAQIHPLVKIYDNLEEAGLTEKKVSQWILNERLEGWKEKRRVRTYKYISGLMMKVKLNLGGESHDITYMTLTLKQNGLLQINVELTFPVPLEIMLNAVNTTVNTVLEKLNKLVFTMIQNVDITLEHIISFTNSYQLNFYIYDVDFYHLLSLDYIKNNIVGLVDRSTPGMLSAKFVKYGYKTLLNIEDNKYDQSSSIIKIYNITSLNEGNAIITVLHKLNEMFHTIDKNPKPAKTLEEKESGFARKCQHKPIVLKEKNENVDKIHSLQWNNKKYKCDLKEHTYIGFTRQGILCCFKNNQQGKEQYILNTNPKALDILVQPSNYKITLKHQNIETFVIKLVSPIRYDIRDMSKYYYINNDDLQPLIAIVEKELVNDIEKTEHELNSKGISMWLPTVTLSKLLYISDEIDKKNPPDFSKRSLGDINKMCSDNDKKRYFGYNKKSIPDCFLNKPPLRQEYVLDGIYKTKILKHDLIDKQIGELPEKLGKILKANRELLNREEGDYYKISILKNNSFINAICLGVTNKPFNMIFYSVFKVELLTYMKNNEIVFPETFSTKEDYLNHIINMFNSYRDIYWKDIIDVLEDMTQHNIIILNELKQDDYKIICKKDFKYQHYLVLLKQDQHFEIVTRAVSEARDVQKKIKISSKKDETYITKHTITSFSENESLVDLLLKYHKASCQIINKYPESYKYDEPYDIKYILNISCPKIGQLKYKIINIYNKILFIMTDKHFMIPIKEHEQDVSIQLETITLNTVIERNMLLDLETFTDYMDKLNSCLAKELQIREIIDSDIDKVGGIVTNMYIIIPYLQSDKVNSRKIYYPGVDDLLKYETGDITKEIDIEDHINYTKTTLSNVIESLPNKETVIDAMKKLHKSTKYTRSEKINKLLDMFNKIKERFDESEIVHSWDTHYIDFIFRHIANQVINYNIYSLLNKIDTRVIRIKDNTIIYNMNDMNKWLQKYSKIDEE